jgi:hypothetical protein
MFDLNDTEPQRPLELIPDGTFAKLIMTVRPGGVDGHGERDKGLLRASTAPGSDVLSLNCELTVLEGPHARRKFRQLFTVAGGKVDEKGVSVGWNMTKRTLRAMIDSALGLDPADDSAEAVVKRRLSGLADLNGITFVGKITIEPSNDPRYPDKNKLERPVLPTEKEWRAVMEGQDVPPSPSRQRASAASGRTPPRRPRPGRSRRPPARGQGRYGRGHRLAAPDGPARRAAPVRQVCRPGLVQQLIGRARGSGGAERRQARGFGYVHQMRRDLFPVYRFCSRHCQAAGAALASRNKGMIDATPSSARRSRRRARRSPRPFASCTCSMPSPTSAPSRSTR